MADDRTAGGGHFRYPGLDFLRALAIVLVVNCHVATTFGSRPEYRPLQLGGKGVDLFFVLSGWLLGRQLIRELRDTNTIDLRRFWYRRWLRTLPAYYAVLAFTYAWQIVRGNYDLRWSYWFFGQTYLTDLPYFGISWSLCVEEHFYLAVAPVLLLFWRVRLSLVLLPVLLVLPYVCRLMGWLVHPDGGGIETHARYDPCAVGVLLAAIDVARPRLWALLRKLAPFLGAGRASRRGPRRGLPDEPAMGHGGSGHHRVGADLRELGSARRGPSGVDCGPRAGRAVRRGAVLRAVSASPGSTCGREEDRWAAVPRVPRSDVGAVASARRKCCTGWWSGPG